MRLLRVILKAVRAHSGAATIWPPRMTNDQTPMTKESPITKSQSDSPYLKSGSPALENNRQLLNHRFRLRRHLVIGYWSFLGAWDLVIGNFTRRDIRRNRKSGMWSRCAPAIVAMALLWQSDSMAGVKVGDPIPDLSAFKLEGKLPETLKGKVVLLDFWASWCDPCRDSFPVMDELTKRYGSQGFVIIAVNVDEKKADMDDFLAKHHASFSIVRDAGQKLVEKTEIATMPTSFLIDANGKVRFVHSGFKGNETKKKYQEEIESLLKK